MASMTMYDPNKVQWSYPTMCKSHILYSLHALCTSGDRDYTLCQHLVGDGTKAPQIQWKHQLHQSLTHQESPMNCLLGQPATHRITTSFVWQLPITCPASVQIDIMHGTIAKNHKPHSSNLLDFWMQVCMVFTCMGPQPKTSAIFDWEKMFKV